MAYFTQEFIDFFSGLSRNNTREWFQAHKKEYERGVKRPFNDFVAEMIEQVAAIDPAVAIDPKDAIFRVARDTRFSKDKTPYKTFVAAVIKRGGRKDVNYPGLFFKFGADGIDIGGGIYQPDARAVQQIRQAIVRDGGALARAIEGTQFRDLFTELRGEQNKRLPKEFAEVAERYAVIANKEFYYYATYNDSSLLLRNDLDSYVVAAPCSASREETAAVLVSGR
jgi:uncharacterized protein (TIGR02453 family)